MRKKGLSGVAWMVLLFVIVAAVGVSCIVISAKPARIAPKPEFKAEFVDLFLPEEVQGTDLIVGNITPGVTESTQPTDTDGITGTDSYWFNTTYSPVVDDSETMLFYDASAATNTTLTRGTNYTAYNYDEGAFQVTSVPAYNSSEGDKLYIDNTPPYKYQNTSIKAYYRHNNTFTGWFLTPWLDEGESGYVAFTFQLDDKGKSLEIGCSLDNIGNTEFRQAYILPDKEGITMDVDNAIVKGEISNDAQEFEIEKERIKDGDYVLVAKIKAVNGDMIRGKDKIEFDISGGDLDTGKVWIQPKA